MTVSIASVSGSERTGRVYNPSLVPRLSRATVRMLKSRHSFKFALLSDRDGKLEELRSEL